MSIYIGNNKYKEIYLGSNKISEVYLGSSKIYSSTPPGPDPYNPLNLPANTIRVRTDDGEPPINDYGAAYQRATLVSGTTDVYDVYKNGTDFYNVLRYSINVVEVLGANTTGVTDMGGLFQNCSALTTVPLFDTFKVTNMQSMFSGCSSLTSIQLFNTSKVTNMNAMFSGCINVQSGALALYNQASSQAVPPSYHSRTFYNCGSDTTTGAAELAQIPSDWK